MGSVNIWALPDKEFPDMNYKNMAAFYNIVQFIIQIINKVK